MDSMSWTDKQGVFAHEIGHALGLDHVNDTKQVMSTALTGREVYLPGSDDIAGANYLY
ncbi:matrixin family metalloprotease [Paenibacillus senegalensis]|uniref:matrixin family metalloprotease n=1 Tax=Paenibacillus senegalensis TaxID=1465766 RepID=UPI0009DB26C4